MVGYVDFVVFIGVVLGLLSDVYGFGVLVWFVFIGSLLFLLFCCLLFVELVFVVLLVLVVVVEFVVDL